MHFLWSQKNSDFKWAHRKKRIETHKKNGWKNENKSNYARTIHKHTEIEGRLSQVYKTGSIHTKRCRQRLSPRQALSVFQISLQSQNKTQRSRWEKGKREEKEIMVVFRVCGMTAQSIQVQTDVCNLTVSVQSPTHFFCLILKIKSTWTYL